MKKITMITAMCLAVLLMGIGQLPIKQTASSMVPTKEENALMEGFALLDSDFCCMVIQTWAEINETFNSEEKMEKFLERFAKTYGIVDIKIVKEPSYEKTDRGVSLKGKIGFSSYAEVFLRCFGEGNDKSAFLWIELGDTENIKNYDFLRALAEAMICRYDKSAEITALFQGSYTGNYHNQLEKVIKNVYDKIDIESVESEILVNDVMKSYYGYTDKVSDYIIVGKSKININIAARYNEEDDKTYIWLGSPLIAMDY